MRICMVGTGYVGLVTGTCLAEMGNEVVCVDTDRTKVERLVRGELPIYEPGLAPLVQRNQADGRLLFTTDLARGVDGAQLAFIAVGTPQGEDGSADLQHVLAAAAGIAGLMTGYLVVVVKSTVPVGTCDRVRATIADVLRKRGRTIGFDVVSNPEFLKEGDAVADFLKPDRVVVGTGSAKAADMLRELYAPYARSRDKVIVVDVRSSEMIKYAANAMLATKISFMNEMARICDLVGADVEHVRKGIGADSRIGFSFIYPGLGYGGSCFPKDVRALEATARDHDHRSLLLSAVTEVNSGQRPLFLSKIAGRLGPDHSGRRFAVWGLAFKPETDDVREAPSLDIVRGLLERGGSVCAFDPVAVDSFAAAFGSHPALSYADHNYRALDGADALIICTEWHLFRRPDFPRIRDSLKERLIFDGRNLYNPEEMAALGLEYHSIGRPVRRPSGPLPA